MSISRRHDGGGSSANKPRYLTAFVHRSHQIVKMGYDLLEAPLFRNSEEQDITGELTRAMQEAVQDLAGPKWAKHFSISEELPVHEAGRLGKRRRRVDIEVTQHGRAGSRPKFRFEAKRLRNGATRREYLGEEGLGCFLNGHYAADDDRAGMLGYVQADSVENHSTSLATSLLKEREIYRLQSGGEWTQATIVDGLMTFQSMHDRSSQRRTITIFHTLLLFR